MREEARKKFWQAYQGGFICTHCGRRVSRSFDDGYPLKATVDHLTPLAANGSNELGNLALACLKCNQLRGWMTHWMLQKDQANAPSLPSSISKHFDWLYLRASRGDSSAQLSFDFESLTGFDRFAKEKRLVAEALTRLRTRKKHSNSLKLRQSRDPEVWQQQTQLKAAKILAKLRGEVTEESIDSFVEKVKEFCASRKNDPFYR